jgi:DnaJ like chaperone protein
MSIWGKVAGAAAGLAAGGPIGALLGGVAGHYVIDRDSSNEALPENQVAFTVGVIALGAKMAKADGIVTRDEVMAFKEVFKVPEGEMKNLSRIFDLAKQDVVGYEAYAEQLASLLKGNRKLLDDVLEGLFHIAKADGVFDPREEQFLAEVASALDSPIPSSATSKRVISVPTSAILMRSWASRPGSTTKR